MPKATIIGRPRSQLSGKRFGKLIVVAFRGVVKRNSIWYCRCDCGKFVTRTSGQLRPGRFSSCGCFHHIKHGHTSGKFSSEYNSWRAMLARCGNHKNNRFYLYGGRGIKVCVRWKKSFALFLKDMGKKPSPKHSIDRKDSNGNYTRRNCRWATALTQRHNRRKK